jgi:hypothetical protein
MIASCLKEDLLGMFRLGPLIGQVSLGRISWTAAVECKVMKYEPQKGVSTDCEIC